MVLNFDPKTERISLGLKQKSENPWLAAEKRYPVGTVVRGKVVSMTDYGAFVQIEEGIEGMVHVSEERCFARLDPERTGHPPPRRGAVSFSWQHHPTRKRSQGFQ